MSTSRAPPADHEASSLVPVREAASDQIADGHAKSEHGERGRYHRALRSAASVTNRPMNV
jgi:hypothetical protein